MNIAVGLIEERSAVRVALRGDFIDSSGNVHSSGNYHFTTPVTLRPSRPEADSFILEDVPIGVGFHWERQGPQGFRGVFRVVEVGGGLRVINDVGLNAYVESVISSEMSAKSPTELLKAHAIISRSWLVAEIRRKDGGSGFRNEEQTGPREWNILCWYGREAHDGFDVCADDHCQRYQGLIGAASRNVRHAVAETENEFLVFGEDVCDARFSKCCGGVTEDYRSAWDDHGVPYLKPVYDGEGRMPWVDDEWIRSSPDAYCNTTDASLLSGILTGFDQETTDFFRWRVDYSSAELSDLVRSRTGIDLGEVVRLEPLERGASGRIVSLRVRGDSGSLTVGKELEIRRVLSPSHLYSSAFVVDEDPGRTALCGAGWGHGVGLCQIGAAVMAERGFSYDEILRHYYPGTFLEVRRV